MSMPLSTQKIVRPVAVSPWRIAQCMALMPRCLGSSDGWYWIVPSAGSSSTRSGRMCVTNAITPRSGCGRGEGFEHVRLLELARGEARDAGVAGRGPQRVGPLRRCR